MQPGYVGYYNTDSQRGRYTLNCKKNIEIHVVLLGGLCLAWRVVSTGHEQPCKTVSGRTAARNSVLIYTYNNII